MEEYFKFGLRHIRIFTKLQINSLQEFVTTAEKKLNIFIFNRVYREKELAITLTAEVG